MEKDSFRFQKSDGGEVRDMTVKSPEVGAARRQPMSNTKLLMLIAIGIFVTMYAAAMIFLGKRFLTLQEIFNLLNNNAYLIILGCSLTIVMIGGGIDISVGAVTSLVVMSCVLYLNAGGKLFLSLFSLKRDISKTRYR